MATDTTIPTETAAATFAEAREGEVERATLTQGATQVQVPQGENVVRIQVTPGETIQLPFPQDAMVARLDDGNGNLAVKVGDVTIILQGYVAAVGEADVTLLDNAGQAVDIAAVVAATDPNLDIQTAAGPAAGAPGGADNTGGVFSPFDPLAGVGGLNAIGGLNPTGLQYNLIQREFDVIEEDEEAAADAVPSLVGLTPGNPVNEDDLGNERTESFAAKMFEPFPDHVLSGLQDALPGLDWASWSGAYETGNDPFDTQDHEDGSQQQPGFPDDAGGIDQDREPLTTTAVASVNFLGAVPGHLSFENAGSTPIIDQLTAMGLTSHSNPLQYLVLAGQPDSDPNDAIDDSRGETLVAYYVVEPGGEQDYAYAQVVFTISFREFEGIDPISDFNIDFTIYGVVDNVSGIADADGDILEALDIAVPFFMVDSNGTATPVPDGSLVFKDIDDVPALGSLCFDWVETEGEYGAWLPVDKHPSDDDIGHDESAGNQGGEEIDLPSYYVDRALDAAAAGGFTNLPDPMAASQTHITVSFGADGRAGTYDEGGYVGNMEAGKTVFTGDGDANTTAFQLYMGGADNPLSEGETNWSTNAGGETQTILVRQVDAQTIVGYVLGEAEGDEPAAEIPVFILRIDPQNGEVVLVQLAQINHPDTEDHNDLIGSLKISPVGGAPSETVLEDNFDNLDGWTVVSGGSAQIVGDVGTLDPQPDPLNQALLVSGGGNDSGSAETGDIESFFGLPAGSLAAAADDGDASNGSETPTNGSAIRREVDVQAGDTLTVRFNFLESEDDEGGEEGSGDAPSYQDFAFIVIGGEVIRLANVGEAGTGTSNSYGSFSWSEESGYLTFTFNFAVDGPIQIGFGVMNEGDTSVDVGLLIDHLEISRGDGESVTVRATDYDGDYVETPLGVRVRDDGPVANDDTDSLVEEETFATGNVLTGMDFPGGDENGSDGVADVSGVDDGEVSKLVGSKSNDDDGSDGFSVTGLYGTLVMERNGNYTYTLDPNAVVPEDAIDVFTYTLTDGDGDSDTAMLTISLPETIIDAAEGRVLVSGCVAEDLQPGQWAGDQTEMPEALSITFGPADNETATGGSVDIPAGWSLQVWDTAGAGSEVALLGAGSGVDIDLYIASVLSGAYELRPVPPADADADGLFTLHLEIEDPDSGLTSVLDHDFTVYLDAVADKPTNVTISITDDGYEQNDKGSKITVGENDGVFTKNETGSLLVTASFGDTDGSEAHTVRVDLPAPFTFQNLPAEIPGVQSYAFDGNDLVLTLEPGTTDFSYAFDIVASGLVGNNTFDAYGTTDPFKVTARAAETPTDGGCGPDDTDADPTDPDGALDNQAVTVATLTRPNILNGEFVTNTNVQKQVALLTFVDQNDPLRAYAQLVVRGSQGQQGAVLTDVGFLIDSTHDYLVGAEATAGTKVIITDLTLEGVRIVDPGNAQVEVDNKATGANEGTAIVTTINPDGDAGQYVGFEYSKDDSLAGGNPGLTDSDAATPDYVFGATGDDTIVASKNGTNILNGGDILDAANNGADHVTGGSGTDILVYDALDTLDGGAGFDILRVDQGAIFNTMTAEGLDLTGTGLVNATVNLTGKSISNIESILITEEATPGAVGTKLILNAADVLGFTDDSKDADGLAGNTLYVLGSGGDSLELHLGGATINSQSAVNDTDRGMTFTQYNLSNGGTLIVDSDVAVTTVP